MMAALRLLARSAIGPAGVAELVDALVLGTSGESRGGSSPSARTIELAFASAAAVTASRFGH
jgi:hypothetical protein